MKTIKLSLAFVFLLAATTSNVVWAHGHARVGVYFGAPLFWPGYYSAPYYNYGPGYDPYYRPYYGTTTVITQPAPVYIEQAPAPAPAPAPRSSSDSSWYYCNNPDGYYPYVKECRTGWQRVAPQPQ